MDLSDPFQREDKGDSETDMEKKSLKHSEDLNEEVSNPLFCLEEESGEEHRADCRGNPWFRVPVYPVALIGLIAKY